MLKPTLNEKKKRREHRCSKSTHAAMLDARNIVISFILVVVSLERQNVKGKVLGGRGLYGSWASLIFGLELLSPSLSLLEALFAGFTQLNLTAPFRLENLRRSNTTAWIGIQDGIDDIATPSLCPLAFV